MVNKKHSESLNTIWTYAYQIVPPQPEGVLDAIKHLLDAEHADAVRGARTWAGRMILEPRVTHILVVSDSPEQRHEFNGRLEAELKRLSVGFLMTAPMAVGDDQEE
jgi:hypothetical protein